MGRLDIPQVSKGFFATVMPFRTSEGKNRYDAPGLLRTMEEVFAAQEAAAGSRRIDAEVYDDAEYAMVVLIDELAIVSDWAYRNEWAQDPLELKKYNTNVGGEEFFDRLDKLRKRFTASRNEDDRETVLGALEVFYTCIECGFVGRYRGGGEGEIEAIRRGLLGLLWPEAEMRRQPHLFPEAYGEGGRADQRRRGIGKWPFIVGAAIVLVVVMYLAFQFMLGSRAETIKTEVREREEASLKLLEGDPR